ncbi:head-tail connector protein [Pseudonocardia hydrocarbonoxydans]|uniref:Phage gp6-like head-tail connector protein n=1 Tax=Pseudonocardia hydrocarbonoxydans TaxID=76726 RepID=A0A4Y3WQ44_9PSEU|nr:head-tail connector protein [Pseudonocardia hydrocarbonoxydans]GEC20983.1 hypothetical protein PHY01_32660 [Pseudonocardia hydrocarbonoxydans]
MAWVPSYVSLAEAKAYVRVADALDDAELNLAVAAASRIIDDHTHRQFGLLDAPAPRIYTARRDPVHDRWVVEIDDLMTESGLVIGYDAAGDGGYATAIPGYALRPVNAAPSGWPWTALVLAAPAGVAITDRDAGVRVTARWGWTTVPDAIRQACLLQTSRLLSRRDSPYGIAGSPEAGSELRLLARVDPDVAVALAPYRRHHRWGFA